MLIKYGKVGWKNGGGLLSLKSFFKEEKYVFQLEREIFYL
jgi:hypothetical protein